MVSSELSYEETELFHLCKPDVAALIKPNAFK